MSTATELDVGLLRDTLELALAATDAFPTAFYERLFRDHGELRAMFHRSSPGAQSKMFSQKLVALVDHLDDPTWIARELGAMTASHRGYGVRPEMYPWVGDALIATLRDACGATWSDAAERAWLAAYDRLAQAMLQPA
ncbi:MAG: globin domain-containing protein [Proteobacteria bacterium]|nr:globin domain-containing protein [Pseudomonadota bacterium]